MSAEPVSTTILLQKYIEINSFEDLESKKNLEKTSKNKCEMNLGKSRDCTQRKSSRSLPVLLSIKRLSAATSVSHLKIVMLLLLISYPLSLINATNLLFSYTLSAYLRGSLTNISILIIGIEYDSLPAPGRGTMAQSQRPNSNTNLGNCHVHPVQQ